MVENLFDLKLFHRSLDSVRIYRDLSWREVAFQTGVAASTLTRMGQGKKPDINGLAALIIWSGLNFADFVDGATSVKRNTLVIVTEALANDSKLSNKNAEIIDSLVKLTYKKFTESEQ